MSFFEDEPRHDVDCTSHGHHPVPISRDIREPHDRAATKWRCRYCGERVDPSTRAQRH